MSQVLHVEVLVAPVDEWINLFCKCRRDQMRVLQNVWDITADVALNVSIAKALQYPVSLKSPPSKAALNVNLGTRSVFWSVGLEALG